MTKQPSSVMGLLLMSNYCVALPGQQLQWNYHSLYCNVEASLGNCQLGSFDWNGVLSQAADCIVIVHLAESVHVVDDVQLEYGGWDHLFLLVEGATEPILH